MTRLLGLLIATVALCSVGHAQPTRDDALAVLRQAGAFYHQQVSSHGGYVWQVSGDLKLRKGEGLTDEHTIWVQPPGTTEVGLAFMDAYYATGEQMFLDAAVDVAHALVQGQLVSGGWYYSISFDPAPSSMTTTPRRRCGCWRRWIRRWSSAMPPFMRR
jgi:hypothetical protein